jgi:hypothetical protein
VLKIDKEMAKNPELIRAHFKPALEASVKIIPNSSSGGVVLIAKYYSLISFCDLGHSFYIH